MTCLVSSLSQSVKNIAKVAWKQALSHECINASNGCVIVWKFYTVIGEHQVDDGFAEHP